MNISLHGTLNVNKLKSRSYTWKVKKVCGGVVKINGQTLIFMGIVCFLGIHIDRKCLFYIVLGIE